MSRHHRHGRHQTRSKVWRQKKIFSFWNINWLFSQKNNHLDVLELVVLFELDHYSLHLGKYFNSSFFQFNYLPRQSKIIRPSSIDFIKIDLTWIEFYLSWKSYRSQLYSSQSIETVELNKLCCMRYTSLMRKKMIVIYLSELWQFHRSFARPDALSNNIRNDFHISSQWHEYKFFSDQSIFDFHYCGKLLDVSEKCPIEILEHVYMR